MDPHASSELIQAVAAACAVARLIHLNLHRRFPALFGYLIFISAINFAFGMENQASNLYFWTYLIVEPGKCVFSIMAVRELFSLTFDNYPGIRTIGRWVMYVGVTLSLTVSLFLTGFFWSGTAAGRAHSILFYFEVSQRSIVFTLAAVIAANLIFLSRYPLHLTRNSSFSSALFSLIFLSDAARLLLDSMTAQLNYPYVDLAEAAIISVCLFAWAAVLHPETKSAPVTVKFSTPREDQLLQQLNAMNHLITRAAKR